MGRRTKIDKERVTKRIIAEMIAEVEEAGGYMTLAKFCKLFAKLAGLSENINNPSQSPGLKRFLEEVTSGENARFKPVEIKRGKSKRFFIALPEMDLETIKSARRTYTPRGRKQKRISGGRGGAQKQIHKTRLMSGYERVLDVIIELCFSLKFQGKKRQKAIEHAEKQMERIETRLASLEKEMQGLRENLRVSGDGADNDSSAAQQKKVLDLIREIKEEE